MKYVLYFNISTFRSMCAVPNMAVFRSSLTPCFPVMLFRYCLCNFEMVQVATIISGITFASTFNMCWISIMRSLYIKIFSGPLYYYYYYYFLQLPPISEIYILKTVKCLRPSTYVGLYTIPTFIINNCFTIFNNKFNPQHHGFSKVKSTTTNLVHCLTLFTI